MPNNIFETEDLSKEEALPFEDTVDFENLPEQELQSHSTEVFGIDEPESELEEALEEISMEEYLESVDERITNLEASLTEIKSLIECMVNDEENDDTDVEDDDYYDIDELKDDVRDAMEELGRLHGLAIKQEARLSKLEGIVKSVCCNSCKGSKPVKEKKAGRPAKIPPKITVSEEKLKKIEKEEKIKRIPLPTKKAKKVAKKGPSKIKKKLKKVAKKKSLNKTKKSSFKGPKKANKKAIGGKVVKKSKK